MAGGNVVTDSGDLYQPFPAQPGQAGGPDPRRDQIQTWYQQYLGRPASDAEIDSWLRDHPDMSGVEEGIKGSREGKNTSNTAYHDGVVSLYQQYLGRTPSEEEIRGWYQQHPNLAEVEPLLKGSPEAAAYAKAHPATPAPTTPGAPGTPGTGTTGYDATALRQALLANGAPANAAELKKFIDAHPEFATGVTIGGSKGNKLYGPGGVFLADVIQGTSGSNPTWAWDAGIGGGAGAGADGQTVDPSYLAGYPGAPFEAPPDAALPQPFEYQDFAAPDGFQAPDAQSILQDPSYTFRRDQALGALQNSASGKGLTNSGGTIYDLLGTASQFASQEYGNIWNRDFGKWQDDYQNALTNYTTNYNKALTAYGTNKTLGDDYYTRARDEFDANVKDYYSNRDSAFDKLYKYAALGANVTTAP